ncbi:MAG: tellurium resistance protein TerC [Hellea sp.]|nr:tellurium resistance protein TerC [Hellea sp.]
MENFFSLESMFTLLMLILLQAVLGFDNLLYIVIESSKVGDPKDAKKVRTWGIAIAVVLRIILLILIVALFDVMASYSLNLDWGNFLYGDFTVQAAITLFGGAFIIYTAVKEITHMMAVEHIEHSEGSGRHSLAKAIAFIVLMNLVFSFDSILSAMAIASVPGVDGAAPTYQVPLMAIAIIMSGLAMIFLADYVTEFLKKNRMYQIMGLFILFLVGVLLVTEGAHLAHLKLFGFEMQAMSKPTFYLVIGVLVITDVISSRYQKRLWKQKEAEIRGDHPEIDGLAAVDKAMGH